MFKELVQELHRKQAKTMTKKSICDFVKEECYRDYFIQFDNHIYHFNNKNLESLVKDIIDLEKNTTRQYMLEGNTENEFLGNIAKFFLTGGKLHKVFYII